MTDVYSSVLKDFKMVFSGDKYVHLNANYVKQDIKCLLPLNVVLNFKFRKNTISVIINGSEIEVDLTKYTNIEISNLFDSIKLFIATFTDTYDKLKPGLEINDCKYTIEETPSQVLIIKNNETLCNLRFDKRVLWYYVDTDGLIKDYIMQEKIENLLIEDKLKEVL